MGKKKNKNFDLFERGLIRWEFLRRNQEYKSSYQKGRGYEALRLSIVLSPNMNSEHVSGLFKKYYSLSLVSSERKKMEKKLMEIYFFLLSLGKERVTPNNIIDIPIIPHTEDLLWDFYLDSSGKKQLCIMKPNKIMSGKIKSLDSKNKEEIVKSLPNLITIKINLKYRKEELMQAIGKELDRWLELMEFFGLKSDKRTQDYGILKRYLEIYDMRNSNPKPTFKEIAEKFYSSSAYKNLDSTIQQVKREYKNAERLIQGGYKEIR